MASGEGDFVWTHIVLEIYCADPCEKKYGSHCLKCPSLRGYCDGETDDFLNYIPLWLILSWRIRYWLTSACENLRWHLWERWSFNEELEWLLEEGGRWQNDL